MTKVRPPAGYLLVEPVEDTTTSSGILLAGSEENKGTVLAIGKGVQEAVAEGDVIYYKQHVKVAGVFIVDENHIQLIKPKDEHVN